MRKMHFILTTFSYAKLLYFSYNTSSASSNLFVKHTILVCVFSSFVYSDRFALRPCTSATVVDGAHGESVSLERLESTPDHRRLHR